MPPNKASYNIPEYGESSDYSTAINNQRRADKTLARANAPIVTCIRLGASLAIAITAFNRFHSHFDRLEFMTQFTDLDPKVTSVVLIAATMTYRFARSYFLPLLNYNK